MNRNKQHKIEKHHKYNISIAIIYTYTNNKKGIEINVQQQTSYKTIN